MEAKLIKTEVNYLLKDEQFNVIISTTSLKKEGLSLSLKNCQAIESGYDLDELAKEYMKISSIEFDAFKSGFQKAIEILGDKKFSKEDVRKTFVDAFQKCYEVISSGKFDDIASSIEWLTQTNADNYIQSLQQTEWDVEIVTTKRMENGKSGLDVPIIKPKLDADGCLILKRKI